MNYKRVFIGVLLAIAILWIFGQKIDYQTFFVTLEESNKKFIILSVLFFIGSMYFRIVRWRALVDEISEVSFVQAGYQFLLGFSMNLVVPGRAGDFARLYIAKQSPNAGYGSVIGKLFMEKLQDMSALVSLSLVGQYFLMQLPIQNNYKLITAIALVLEIVLVIGLFWLKKIPVFNLILRWKRINNLYHDILASIHGMKKNNLYFTVCLTVVTWFLDLISFWALLHAIGIGITIPNLVILFSLFGLSGMIPLTPLQIGTGQMFLSFFLVFLGYSAIKGMALATLIQLALYLPIIIVSFFFYYLKDEEKTGLSMGIKL